MSKKIRIDITDVTDHKYITDGSMEEYLYEDLQESVVDGTPHGVCGDPEPVGLYLYKGKYYSVKIEIEWNRYDKQFYYYDGHDNIYCKEVTPEQIIKGEV